MRAFLGEFDGSEVRYSFYERDEPDGIHYVVNYHTSEWWLQLDVVFAARWRWFRTVQFEERPVFNQDRPGILKPQRVVSAVLRGVKNASREVGAKIAIDHFSFTQADFECYELYERASHHLVMHMASQGIFGSMRVVDTSELAQ